jgi:hypothetical protein
MERQDLSHPVELTDEQLDYVTGGASSVNQQGFSPGTFPGGNPANANGNANNPNGK